MTTTAHRPAATGRTRVLPPPISGSAGETHAMPANRLKKSSSGPKMIEGRTIAASGTAARTAASPAALLRA